MHENKSMNKTEIWRFPNVMSALAVALSFSAAIFSYRQMVETERYYEDTKAKAVNLTRAYMAIDEIAIEKFLPGEEPEISVSYKNLGTTQAVDMRVYVSSDLVGIDDNAPSVNLGEPLVQAQFMPPGTSRAIRQFTGIKVTQEDYEQFKNGRKTIKANVIIKYGDAYGGDQEIRVCITKHKSQLDDPRAAAFCKQ